MLGALLFEQAGISQYLSVLTESCEAAANDNENLEMSQRDSNISFY
jgi:hypothetical protein